MAKGEPAIIYNLFPRLLGNIDRWMKHIDRISRLNFNWIYVNPFHYPGFSGSLYAPKDYFAFNPVFVSDGQDGFRMLKRFTDKCRKKGIFVMMDLVINHSASDCILVEQHPEWYKREEDGSLMHPFCVDPADTRKKTVWGDLAEIDNSPDSAHRQDLWEYWLELIRRYIEIGFKGFRADAAYKVPTELWDFLISSTKKTHPDIAFFAETLGAKEDDLKNVVKAGFDYVTNSSKWWDFQADWCPRQYEAFRKYAPSVSFPESHDTTRLFDDLGGNVNGLKMWYGFSAFFSASIMMPLGFEWGFRKRVNVVHTMPQDFEEKNTNISAFINAANKIKKSYKIFRYDSPMQIVTDDNETFFAMMKTPCGGKGKKAVVVINKDIHNVQYMDLSRFKEVAQITSPIAQVFPKKASLSKYSSEYAPGEVRVFV